MTCLLWERNVGIQLEFLISQRLLDDLDYDILCQCLYYYILNPFTKIYEEITLHLLQVIREHVR